MIQTNVNDTGTLIVPGQALVLQCYLEDRLEVHPIWYKGGQPVNLSDPRIAVHNANHSLVIHKTTAQDTGPYMCVMDSAVVGSGINTTIYVNIKPEVKPFGKSLNLVEGEELKLHCAIKMGMPLPSITWLKDSQPLNLSDDRISLLEDNVVPNAKLVIADLQMRDRATYTCVAENLAGNSSTSTLVRVKNKLGALWPFIGICGEVAILCFIIFLYEKKRVNPDYDESDTDQQTDK
ncbi:NPTN [Cordylochernes scorpioides]|uniref:NPTN n=1 Tax=Cordylochernes scorpioides TaxID=51811 RepID=A0ABY6KHI2_9ARAC|nr:NPTN [Cordylochernes scorpioides]